MMMPSGSSRRNFFARSIIEQCGDDAAPPGNDVWHSDGGHERVRRCHRGKNTMSCSRLPSFDLSIYWGGKRGSGGVCWSPRKHNRCIVRCHDVRHTPSGIDIVEGKKKDINGVCTKKDGNCKSTTIYDLRYKNDMKTSMSLI
jgi:hypothetical protein